MSKSEGSVGCLSGCVVLIAVNSSIEYLEVTFSYMLLL
jgi:hypothetical protein